MKKLTSLITLLTPLIITTSSYAKELKVGDLMPELESYNCKKIKCSTSKVPGTKSSQEVCRCGNKTEIKVYYDGKLVEVKFIERGEFCGIDDENGKPDGIADKVIYLKRN